MSGAGPASTLHPDEAEALREAIEAHAADAYRLARHMLRDHHEAEDVTQDALLKAWRHRATLRDAGAARVWLLKITANLCRDRLRRRARRGARETLEREPLCDGPDAARVVEGREALAALRRHIDALPRRCRDVLHLSVFQGLSHAEVAEVLSTTTNSVKVSLSQARKRLRDAVAEDAG